MRKTARTVVWEGRQAYSCRLDPIQAGLARAVHALRVRKWEMIEETQKSIYGLTLPMACGCCRALSRPRRRRPGSVARVRQPEAYAG